VRPSTPGPLLVEHPALPSLIDGFDPEPRSQSVNSLNPTDRLRVAVQLVAVTALLADFELWPGRPALRRASVELTDQGPRVRLPALPAPLSRIWSRLGGGDPAAEATKTAVLATIGEVTGLDGELSAGGGSEPGFFLDSVLARLLDQLGRPLDQATARSLWMWRWSLPALPENGDTSLLAVPDDGVARRLGAAAWAAARRSGASATLEIARPGRDPARVADGDGEPRVRVLTGTFDDRVLASIVDRSGERDVANVVIGVFPDGWNPDPAPVFDAERMAGHLTVTGASPARRRRLVDGLQGRFNPFSEADRRSLTRWASTLYSLPRRRTTGRFRELADVVGLVPGGIPVDRALALSGVGRRDLKAACEAHAVVRRLGRLMPPTPVPLAPDPRHAELVDLFDEEDPRRLFHAALASGDTGALLEWTRARLDDLDPRAVRGLLTGLRPGVLGPGVQTALAEACLCLADIHGARRALEGLGDENARPWASWMRLLDRPAGFEVETPRSIDLRHAPRACAEIGLINLRRALSKGSEPDDAPLRLVRSAVSGLRGRSRRWIEIKLASLIEPERLDERAWRQSMTEEHPDLVGLILFEQSVKATLEGRTRLAKRLLRRVMSAERTPGRLALMQVNLGVLEAEDGRHSVAEALTLGAFRLFQTAGYRHRSRDALHNLAVADIDQLRVDRAAARLDSLSESSDTLYARVERARLDVAVGDLERFRTRLAELPRTRDHFSIQIVQALSFLYGVETLFFDSPAKAIPLFRAGGEEGAAWLDLVEALEGEPGSRAQPAPDSWGVRRAAAVARSIRNDGSKRSFGSESGDDLEVEDAMAVALCRQLGIPFERSLRLRAASVLASRGLNGWASRLRWDGPEVEDLLRSLSKLVRNGASERTDEGSVVAVLAALGIGGLVVRSAMDGRELWRVGDGKPRPAERHGSLELVALGSEPVRGPAWDLFCDLLDLVRSPERTGEPSSVESDVRIDGVSPAAARLRDDIRNAAGPRFTVLVHGETGSGKEVVAREIHRLSGRDGQLVTLNVAAVPSNLLEAELFGTVRGAFTGADRSRRGLVAAAEGGTLFLDEVGDLDVALQVKLLRLLESGEVRAVGSDRTRHLDVRVVCATHRNLERRVREGRFREDLFYRIAVATVQVPALRERTEDVLILRTIFAKEAARRHGLALTPWTAAAERRLLRHPWPGNVRELKHTVEVAMARASGAAIRPDHLPLAEGRPASRGTWEAALGGFKRKLLTEVLRRHRGNRSAAARELGVSRQALLYQIRKLDLRDL
jgi:sigma-54-dependent transcriptional regulator